MHNHRFHRIMAFLLLLSLLLSLGGAALTQPALAQDGQALVAVFVADMQDLIRFDTLGWPVYQRLQGHQGEYLLTAGPASEVTAFANAGFSYEVLDSISDADYYLVYPSIGRAKLQWETYGQILLDDGIQMLMRLNPDDALRLVEAGAELARVTFDPKPLQLEPVSFAPSDVTPDPLVQQMIDQITYATVYSYTGNLSGEWPVDIGGSPYTIYTRNTNSGTPIQKATQFVGEHFSNLGLGVEYHQWGGGTYPNVIAEIPGLTNPDDIYIIGGHLDDMPSSGNAPGADDNASGSVATLIAADILSQYQWGCTLRFALWTGEEQGLNGSAAYAQRSYNQGENILGYLNMDMIAWNSGGSSPDIDLHARSTVPGSMEIAQLYADAITAYGFNLIPAIDSSGSGASDHASFWTYNYPAILAIEDFGDFNPYYHTINDDMDNFEDWPYYVEFVKASIATFVHMTNCLIPDPDFTLEVTPANLGVCVPDDAEYEVSIGQMLGFTDPVTLNVNGEPAGTTATFVPNPVTPADPPATSTLTIGNTGAAAAGSYSLDVIGVAPTSTHTATVGLDIYTSIPGQVSLMSPANGALNVDPLVTFEWGAAAQAGEYTIEIATDSGFTNVIASAVVAGTSYTPATALPTSTVLYWRVTAANTCGGGSVSTVWTFTTEAAPGDCGPGTIPNVLYSENFESGAPGWSSGGTGDTWTLSTVRPYAGTYAYHADDVTSVSDQRLSSPGVSLPSGSSQALTLQYWTWKEIEERSATQCYDGGILEISTDGGSTWMQMETELQTDLYHGPINSSNNPLNGLDAWCEESNPAWIESVVDLDAYASETVQFRYRLGTDGSAGGEGWYLDNLVVQRCIPAGYNFNFGPDSTLLTAPHTDVTHNLILQNLGMADSYTLTLTSGSWSSTLLTGSPVAVPAGGSEAVQVEVAVPDLEGQDIFTITAQSVASPTLLLTATGTTTAQIVPGVGLTPGSSSQTGMPGEVLTHTFSVANTGNYTDSFTLAVVGATWPTVVAADTGALGAGEPYQVEVAVTIPTDPALRAIIASDAFTLTATSDFAGSVSATALGTTYANVAPGVVIGPVAQLGSGALGEIVTYTYALTNTGEYTDSFNLSLSGYDWATSLSVTSTGALSVGESESIDVQVTIPLDPGLRAVVGSDEFTLTAVSNLDGAVSASATGETAAEAEPGIEINPQAASQVGMPGEVVTYTYVITNAGEYADTFALTISSTWTATLSAASTGELAVGEAFTVTLAVAIPADATGGASDLATLTATSGLDAAISASATAETAAITEFKIFLPLIGR